MLFYSQISENRTCMSVEERISPYETTKQKSKLWFKSIKNPVALFISHKPKLVKHSDSLSEQLFTFQVVIIKIKHTAPLPISL